MTSIRSSDGLDSPSILSEDNTTELWPLRKSRQNYSFESNSSTRKILTSSFRLQLQTLPQTLAEDPIEEEEEEVCQSNDSVGQLSPRSSKLSSNFQSSIDIMASTLQCDDCQTDDGLFQCCHCNQRLCIGCCNKHYKKVTIELERLHELSDRLVAKIVHTKNDLERQKNETVEQCHKWRVDTINTINKAHTLIVQTIHDEYETLGKEYELFVQKEMSHLNFDQNELMRMKKGNLSSLLSSTSSTTADSTNSIEAIRKRIETFAKNIDETGKFSFQVKLPAFDIDDNLRVESRFGEVTRSTSATWQNGSDGLSASIIDVPTEKVNLINNIESNQTNSSSADVNTSRGNSMKCEDDETSDVKVDDHESDIESRTTTSSPQNLESTNSNTTINPTSRYAMSVENDIELQQQQFYSPSFRGDLYDSAYGTAPSSPSSSLHNNNDCYSSTSSIHEQPSKTYFNRTNRDFGSFYTNRRHTHTFQRATSPIFPNTNSNNNDDNDDSYRSVEHVELKRETDGSVEGIAVQIQQTHKRDGMIERRRTCMQACGVRRRTTILPSRYGTKSFERSSDDLLWPYYRTNSTPSFTQ